MKTKGVIYPLSPWLNPMHAHGMINSMKFLLFHPRLQQLDFVLHCIFVAFISFSVDSDVEDFEIIENAIYPEMDESRITRTIVHMKEASRLPFLLSGLYHESPDSPWHKTCKPFLFFSVMVKSTVALFFFFFFFWRNQQT